MASRLSERYFLALDVYEAVFLLLCKLDEETKRYVYNRTSGIHSVQEERKLMALLMTATNNLFSDEETISLRTLKEAEFYDVVSSRDSTEDLSEKEIHNFLMYLHRCCGANLPKEKPSLPKCLQKRRAG